MNYMHVNQIFKNYIERFEIINNAKNREYYKWQIAKRFHNEMDAALKAPDSELAGKLYELKKLTSNLIDNYTQPFLGLAKLAEKEPESVRQMFLFLYGKNAGSINERQNRIQTFLKKSHELQNKYYPDSYLYKNDMHSVTGYLFLYDPDNNYIFKATHALSFADCVEFYDDWGVGDTVKLSTYYRMCDELVEIIKSNKELMDTDASRFSDEWREEDPRSLYEDPEKHILAFDLIYCCSTYGLFDGITFTKINTKERHLIQERKMKAQLMAKNLNNARIKTKKLQEAKEFLDSIYTEETEIQHKIYGTGVIRNVNGTQILVEFSGNMIRSLGKYISAVNDIIVANKSGYKEKMDLYCDFLKKEELIKAQLINAEREFAPYAEYFD